MGIDTSTLRRYVSVTHTVDGDGGPVELVDSTHARYGCDSHKISWNSWEDARAHCETFHGDESSGVNGSADIPVDRTEVGEGVSVGLEPPAE